MARLPDLLPARPSFFSGLGPGASLSCICGSRRTADSSWASLSSASWECVDWFCGTGALAACWATWRSFCSSFARGDHDDYRGGDRGERPDDSPPAAEDARLPWIVLGQNCGFCKFFCRRRRGCLSCLFGAANNLLSEIGFQLMARQALQAGADGAVRRSTAGPRHWWPGAVRLGGRRRQLVVEIGRSEDRIVRDHFE